ncbi:deoxyribonuclease IV [bacterium]|nr:deoxyribonuclease IV [bacterium]MBU1983538.1 deoxyribonuclease IV [bacterium]
MLVGAHVSVAGGLDQAFRWYQEFDCESLQIFTKSQLQWKAKPLEPEEVMSWLEAWELADWPPCFVHDSYLINLSSPDEALRKKSVDAFVDELERASLLGIPWVNTHPGSHKGAGEQIGLDNCVRSLKEVLERTEGIGTGILLETTAGQGNDLGSKFENLAYLLEKTDGGQRVGVCYDTCHGFAAGYDIRTAEAYTATFARFDELIGLRFLHAFHLNDCRFPLGSRRDRHAPIGKGEIGPQAFRLLMNDPRFELHPGITELPDDVTPQSLARLKNFRQ